MAKRAEAVTVPVRMSVPAVARLDVVAKRSGMPRSTALRALALLGLEQVDGDPARLLAAPKGVA